MTEEVNIGGVFVPTFLLACIVALGLSVFASRTIAWLASQDLRRFVWHPPLFDFATYVILVGFCYSVLGTLL